MTVGVKFVALGVKHKFIIHANQSSNSIAIT